MEHVDGKARLTTRRHLVRALPSSTVDNSFIPGIGSRLDGLANLDLNPGAIIAASPAVPENAKAIYRSCRERVNSIRASTSDGLSTPLVLLAAALMAPRRRRAGNLHRRRPGLVLEQVRRPSRRWRCRLVHR
jgi:hypothetical protein